MYPYLGFGLLTIILQYFRKLLVHIDYDCGGLEGLISNIFHLENYANWFLPSLFFAEIIAICLLKVAKKRNHLIIIFMMIMPIITSKCIRLLKLSLQSDIHFLILQIGKVTAFVFFLMLGIIFKRIVLEKISEIDKTKRKIIAYSFLAIFVMIFLVASNLSMVDLHILAWKSTKLYFIIAALGSISITLFFAFYDCQSRFLEFIGKNSLLINGTHLNLMIVLLANAIAFSSVPHIAGLYSIGPLLVMGITLVFESVIIIPVFKISFPFLWNYGELKMRLKQLFN